MALAESKALWPEEVVSKTWDVSVLESELVELCTLLALLAHKTVAQLRALYGATDWKSKYPAFKLGRNKRELLDNVKECYLSHAAEVLSLLKPKQKLVGLFDALKNRPELANRASTVTMERMETLMPFLFRKSLLLFPHLKPGAAAGLEECKKEEEKQPKSGKRKRKEEEEEKQAIKEETQKKKRDNNKKDKKDVKKQKPEKKANTNKKAAPETAPKKKEEKKKEGEGEEKEKEKEKEKEQEKRAEAPTASTNNINPAMSLPTETTNTIAPSTPSTAVLADIRSPAELPSNIQFRRQAPAGLAREREQREYVLFSQSVSVLLKAVHVRTLLILLTFPFRGGLLVHQQRVSAVMQQNKRIQQEAVSVQCANYICSLMETLEAEFLEPWTARRVFIEPADLSLVLEGYLQAARMYNNSK
ncbi:IgA-specific serine endopeptidase [Balamuthia mandrillaris]